VNVTNARLQIRRSEATPEREGHIRRLRDEMSERKTATSQEEWVEAAPKTKKRDRYIGEDCPLQGLGRCTKGNCAWWNHIDEECSVATLGALARTMIKRAES